MYLNVWTFCPFYFFCRFDMPACKPSCGCTLCEESGNSEYLVSVFRVPKGKENMWWWASHAYRHMALSEMWSSGKYIWHMSWQIKDHYVYFTGPPECSCRNQTGISFFGGMWIIWCFRVLAVPRKSGNRLVGGDLGNNKLQNTSGKSLGVNCLASENQVGLWLVMWLAHSGRAVLTLLGAKKTLLHVCRVMGPHICMRGWGKWQILLVKVIFFFRKRSFLLTTLILNFSE